MNPTEIKPGNVYSVWINRRLWPVLIEGKNPSGSYYGRVFPGGRHVLIKSAAKISMQVVAPAVDNKSRAAGERDE